MHGPVVVVDDCVCGKSPIAHTWQLARDLRIAGTPPRALAPLIRLRQQAAARDAEWYEVSEADVGGVADVP